MITWGTLAGETTDLVPVPGDNYENNTSTKTYFPKLDLDLKSFVREVPGFEIYLTIFFLNH